MSRVRELLLGGVLLVASFLVALALAEACLRLFVEPVDFLTPRLVGDPVLLHRLEPGSGSHDAWGFRNAEVPERAEIVAIGDSQTYGHSARASGSWPAWMERLSGRRVYNLSLGGYGPLQYRELLERHGLGLQPDWVVVGFYLGNDLAGAFRAAYVTEHWAFLRDESRQAEFDAAAARFTDLKTPPVAIHADPGFSLRAWLRGHSVLYRGASLVFGDTLRAALQSRGDGENRVAAIEDPDGALLTTLDPVYRLRAMELEDARIQEGLRLSLDAIAHMARSAREAGSRLLVLIIPTKEAVYEELVPEGGLAVEQAELERLLRHEREIQERTIAFLVEQGIPYAVGLDPLRARARDGAIYPRTVNGHPNERGYRVLGEAALAGIEAASPDGSSGISAR